MEKSFDTADTNSFLFFFPTNIIFNHEIIIIIGMINRTNTCKERGLWWI